MKRALAVLALWLVLPAGARAHRLDEYLQASRLGIERGRVSVEIDLTPGVAVADDVLAWIDTDRSGAVSPEEADAYARRVLDAITLDVDGRRTALVLLDRQVPSVVDMRQGIGTIRLQAVALTPIAAAGAHRLVYRNLHRPEVSVYLVNALLPDSAALAITDQQRDVQQHELRLNYRIDGGWEPPVLWRPLIAAIAGAGVLTALTWRRRRVTRSIAPSSCAESHLT
jgi:hypothetical protein